MSEVHLRAKVIANKKVSNGAMLGIEAELWQAADNRAVQF